MSETQAMSGWTKLVLAILVGALLFVAAVAGAYFMLGTEDGEEQAVAEATPSEVQSAAQPAALPVPGGQVPLPIPANGQIPTPIGQVPLPLPTNGQIPTPIGQVPLPLPTNGQIPTPIGQIPLPLPTAQTVPQGTVQVPPPTGQVPPGMATPQAVITAPYNGIDQLFGATDVERAELSWAPNDPYCQRGALLTDSLQRFAHGITEAVRAGNGISATDEMQIGNEMYRAIVNDPEFRGTVDTRPELQRYVTAVAQPILAHRQRQDITYTFHIVDQPVVNAFAIPGGHIFVYTGLLLDRQRIWNEAQLAGILAHEIGHVDLRHTTAAYDVIAQMGGAGAGAVDLAQIATSLMEMPYSNEIEDAADRYAISMLFATQYSPLQFEAQWRAWDAMTPNGGSMVPNIQAQDPVTALAVQLGREMENLVLSHSTDSQRACNARLIIEQAMPDYHYAGFYVGRRNLETLTARAQQMF